MSVLTKFLYQFQHIPVLIPKKFFAKLDRSISNFLWANKPVRMREKVPQLPKREGGLALPNFIQYYWAANIQKLMYWIDEPSNDCPTWLLMETASTQTSLRSWLFSRSPAPTTAVSTSPVVTQSLKIWQQFRKHFDRQEPSTLAPAYWNHSFLPSTTDSAFQLWSDRGIGSIKDLYNNGIFMPFPDLSTITESLSPFPDPSP